MISLDTSPQPCHNPKGGGLMSVHDSFPCSSCKVDFPTAEAFSDHFERVEGTILIKDCKGKVKGERAERAAN